MSHHSNYGLQVNLDNEAFSVPDLRARNKVLYESNCELDVDDVRELPSYSFRFGMNAAHFHHQRHQQQHPQHEHLPPLPIRPQTSDSSGADSSNQSTLDHTQWESERSLFSRFRPSSQAMPPRRASTDGNMTFSPTSGRAPTTRTGTGATSRVRTTSSNSAGGAHSSTYSRHYKSINVRPDKKNLLVHKQRVGR